MIKRISADDNTPSGSDAHLDFQTPAPIHWGEKLARNLALSAMLVLAVTAMRNAELPSGDTVLTAVQQMIDGKWDDGLGKISFVGNFLPESVAVFFEEPPETELIAPCPGPVTHAWSESEPYLGFEAGDGLVYAAGAGQVMSLSHGLEDEYILRVVQEDGLEVLYCNLASVNVSEGDGVTAGTCLGEALPQGAVMEVRRAGRPIDPTANMKPRGKDGL